MKPSKWGPYAWVFLHSITFNYPVNPSKEVQLQYKNFFESLQYVIPCDKCQRNYQNKLVKFKLTDKVLKSRKNLIEWLIDIHNEVNKSTGKRILTYKEVIDYYVDFYESKSPPANFQQQCSIMPNILSIFVTIIIALYFIKKKYLI
ncbi:Erv1 / Alr family [seawater metagenome]|uniref:thiol oxidase n=1 Tax=seawater metagenome TaxID=1561972 RepID=A0A5E8CIX3_9ZZZZ